MNYCEKCGTALSGEEFCPNCGASTAPEAPKSKGTIMKLGIAAAALAVIIIAIIAIFGGRSAKATATQYLKAMINGDAKKIVSLMPKKYVNYIADEEFDGDKKEMIEDLEESLEYYKEMYEDRDIDIKKIKYEVTSVKKLDEDDIEEINDNEDFEDAKIKVKAAQRVKIKMTYKVDGEKETEKREIVVYKVGGKWCVLY